MVCNPNNPTGAVMNEEEMDAVVRAAERRGAWIVADEIYRGAEVEGDAALAELLGPFGAGRRHERPVEGLRTAGTSHRLGGRPRGVHPATCGSGTTTRR